MKNCHNGADENKLGFIYALGVDLTHSVRYLSTMQTTTNINGVKIMTLKEKLQFIGHNITSCSKVMEYTGLSSKYLEARVDKILESFNPITTDRVCIFDLCAA